jgi:mannose-6-phosphate isomerase
MLYPLQFEPIDRKAIWGAESWKISDRADAQSRVRNGRLMGKSLHDLVEEYGPNLSGQKGSEKSFPLLIKTIDARDALSLQVHPSEETAEAAGGEPKTEMWVVLQGGPVYAGFKKKVSPDEWSSAVRSNRTIDLTQKYQTKAGDAIFIPGGRIHAIGAGCKMLEVQQNSDTTYRIYDWNRRDAKGNPRKLQLPEAQKCINWNDDDDPRLTLRLIEKNSSYQRFRILSSPFFTVERWEIHRPMQINAERGTFQIFFYLDGPEAGECTLLPAVSTPLPLKGPSSLIRCSRG